tara:strand:- start:22723 stop:23922 length:1200 start_codon:yes stop_codon:yes gene_type:complete
MKVICDISVTSASWRSASWTPAALFASGGNGAWYDIADPGLIYSDPAGLNPATINGPVGLVLDKSQGLALGPELVTNGEFNADASGWTALNSPLIAVAGGSATVEQPGTGSGIYQDIPVTSGQMVRVTVRARRVGSANSFTGIWAMSASDFSSNRVIQNLSTAWAIYVFHIVGSASVCRLYISPQSTGSSVEVDLVSARLLSGNHAIANTFAKRPMLRENANGGRYLEFDGIDDQLITPAFELSNTDKVALGVGVSKVADTEAGGMVCNFSSAGLPSFALQAPAPGNGLTRWSHAGATSSAQVDLALALGAPTVYLAESDLGAPVLSLKSNSAPKASNSGATGGGTYSLGRLSIGDVETSTSQPFVGGLHGLVFLDRAVTAPEYANLSAYLAAETGVTL